MGRERDALEMSGEDPRKEELRDGGYRCKGGTAGLEGRRAERSWGLPRVILPGPGHPRP